MIRKLKSGSYRLYSRKADARTGKRRNLGTFTTVPPRSVTSGPSNISSTTRDPTGDTARGRKAAESAMSMLNLYINRAGRVLYESSQ